MFSSSATFDGQPSSAPGLAQLLSALSFALDLTEGAVPGHALRSCLLSLRLGSDLGLSPAQLTHLYHAALLKDAGCSSNAARLCQITGGDDRSLKAGVKLINWSRSLPDPRAFPLLWKQTLPGRSAFARTLRIARLATRQSRNNREMIQLRCDRGASIVTHLGLPSECAEAVRHLDEHWDGSGYPGRLRHHAIPVLSRLLLVSQHLDVFASRFHPQYAIESLAERLGSWFEPALVRAAQRLHRHGLLWTHCSPSDDVSTTHTAVLEATSRLDPSATDRLTPASLDNICEAFAGIVDAKSPFTFRHSAGVAEAATRMGQAAGLPPERLSTLRRAALLHDLGKLGISNSILDKPGQLAATERAAVERHPALTYAILSPMPGFGEIAHIASEHHERLDGTGYPQRLQAPALSFESRLLATADTYAALAEDRPYRAGLQLPEITGILHQAVSASHLDATCVEAALATHQPPRRPAAGTSSPPPSSTLAPVSSLRVG